MICEYENINNVMESAEIILLQNGDCCGIGCRECMFSKYNVIDPEEVAMCTTIIKNLSKKYLNEFNDYRDAMYKLAKILISYNSENIEIINLEEE